MSRHSLAENAMGTGHGHEFLSAVRVGTRGPVALLTTMFMDHNQRGILELFSPYRVALGAGIVGLVR